MELFKLKLYQWKEIGTFSLSPQRGLSAYKLSLSNHGSQLYHTCIIRISSEFYANTPLSFHK